MLPPAVRPPVPQPEPPALPPCPCCGGPVEPLRGQFRCSRCAFMLCLECDGAMTSDVGHSADCHYT